MLEKEQQLVGALWRQPEQLLRAQSRAALEAAGFVGQVFGAREECVQQAFVSQRREKR